MRKIKKTTKWNKKVFFRLTLIYFSCCRREMESLSNDKVLTYLKEVETAAEDVLTDKQEIVDLDRKRNQNREALRAVQKAAEADYKGDASKVWMATGNTFIKMPSSAAKDMLKSGEDIFFYRRRRSTPDHSCCWGKVQNNCLHGPPLHNITIAGNEKIKVYILDYNVIKVIVFNLGGHLR